MINRIVTEAAVPKQGGQLSKPAAQLSGDMGIGADGKEFTAELTVAGQNALMRIGMSLTIFTAACVAFQGTAFLDQCLKDGIYIIPVVMPVILWAVTGGIIEMAEGVKAFQGTEPLQSNLEVTVVGFFGCFSGKEIRIVWIHTINEVAGADDKIK